MKILVTSDLHLDEWTALGHNPLNAITEHLKDLDVSALQGIWRAAFEPRCPPRGHHRARGQSSDQVTLECRVVPIDARQQN